MRNYLLLLFFISTQLHGQIPRLRLSLITAGLNRATDVAVLDPTTFLISQTNGQIRLVRNGAIQPTPYLDLSSKINDPTWEGIFGLTLHPNYATNGYIYVHYSRPDLSSVYARYTRSSTNPDQADVNTELIILTIPYPYGGHRSGQLTFGADGYLYITTGDSSSGGRGLVSFADRVAQLLAQNMQDLHGKMLRIDVNTGSPYAIPPTNPFADPNDGIRDEIFSAGLRNPWRWSFDRQTGDLWLADVGQDGWEELNRVSAGLLPAQNFGWPCFEGSHPYVNCSSVTATYQMPLLDYPGFDNNGSVAVSITGGYVYRGNAYPTLRGWYIYGDYATGQYWTLKRAPDGTYQQVSQLLDSTTKPVSFAEGADGELYVLSFSNGSLYKLGVEQIVSVKSGAWAHTDTWSCACIPGSGDYVTIQQAHTVSVSQPVQITSLILQGNLSVSASGRVTF